MSLRLLRIESRRSTGLLVFPMLLAVGWWLAGDVMYGEAYVWLDASGGVRYTTIFLGPMIGGVAAWMAGRNRRRGVVEMLSTTPYSPISRDLGVWVGTTLWGISAYALLAIFLAALTWWNATWGAPLPGYFLVGLVAMVFHSAAGYAAGYWMPSRFTAPLAAVGLFFLQFAPEGFLAQDSRLKVLSPVTNDLIYREVFQEIPQLAAQQALWLLGLAGIALASVTLKAGRGNLLALGVLLGSVVVAFIGGVSTVSAADQHEFDMWSGEAVPFEYICKDGEIEVCLHPAYEKVLPETAETVNEIAEPVASIPGVPDRAVQVSDSGSTGRKYNGNAMQLSTSTVRYGASDSIFKDEVAWQLVYDEATLATGPEDRTVKSTPEDQKRCGKIENNGVLISAQEAQAVVLGWLLRRVGSQNTDYFTSTCSNYDALVDRFADLEPAKRRAWLEKNFSDLRVGKIALRDLP